MSFTRLPFGSLEWIPGAHPLERKKLVADHAVVLLEFAAGFEDPNWCERGHIIYVIEGTLELELAGRSELLTVGDACVIDPHTPHRARNPADAPVRLFVVSRDD